MGMQGPLTAQALGRSPYDDAVEGEGEEDSRAPPQQYDHGGRPINPDTIRINRNIIRSHNQVMLVIGVAEPEHPGPEVDSQRRHAAYEESMGSKLTSSSKRCIEAVGIFGVNGLRERILIYKRYSEIPFWELYQQSRKDFSFSRDIFAGAPASLVSNYIERSIIRLRLGEKGKTSARRWIQHVWSYVQVHLELYAAMQRLGLIPSSHWFPRPSYFIPFSQESPIMAPPPPDGFGPVSILRWLSSVFISATPFFAWVLTRRMVRDCKPQIWKQIYKCLPSTTFRGKQILPASESMSQPFMNETSSEPNGIEDGVPLAVMDDQFPGDGEPVEAVRRPSIFSARGDEYASDEEDNDGVRATLISFDVEATESTDAAPPGLWSAELRPSIAADSRTSASVLPTYLDTPLTRLPALMTTEILTNAITRILVTPHDSAALRLIARAHLSSHRLSCEGIYNVSLLSGLSWTSAINYLGTELLHLIISGEVWAIFTSLSQWYHMTEEEWKAEDGKN